jgi:signal transduction histidine kinase
VPHLCCAYHRLTIHLYAPHLCICSFRQVLFNLLSNACKFTPSKGSVSVRIYNDEEHPEEVVASVSDTGIGIKQDSLKLLFAVRYRTV